MMFNIRSYYSFPRNGRKFGYMSFEFKLAACVLLNGHHGEELVFIVEHSTLFSYTEILSVDYCNEKVGDLSVCLFI